MKLTQKNKVAFLPDKIKELVEPAYQEVIEDPNRKFDIVCQDYWNKSICIEFKCGALWVPLECINTELGID